MPKRIIFRPGRNQIGVIQGHGYSDIEMRSMGDGVAYKIGPYHSKAVYHNTAQAWYDAIRPQRITFAHLLVPDLATEADNARLYQEGRLAGCYA